MGHSQKFEKLMAPTRVLRRLFIEGGGRQEKLAVEMKVSRWLKGEQKSTEDEVPNIERIFSDEF